jgi:hypothetical protein
MGIAAPTRKACTCGYTCEVRHSLRGAFTPIRNWDYTPTARGKAAPSRNKRTIEVQTHLRGTNAPTRYKRTYEVHTSMYTYQVQPHLPGPTTHTRYNYIYKPTSYIHTYEVHMYLHTGTRYIYNYEVHLNLHLWSVSTNMRYIYTCDV